MMISMMMNVAIRDDNVDGDIDDDDVNHGDDDDIDDYHWNT